MSASMKRRHLGHLQLLSRRDESPLTVVVAEIEVSRQDKIANPQDVKDLRHIFPEGFVSFRPLCGVQSSPLVLAPNRAFVCGLLQGQAPGGTLCFRSTLF